MLLFELYFVVALLRMQPGVRRLTHLWPMNPNIFFHDTFFPLRKGGNVSHVLCIGVRVRKILENRLVWQA